MCRSIRTLHNFVPPATEEEMRAAALQYVRKIAGVTRPSQANTGAFDEAVEAVTGATRRLVDALVTSAPPKNAGGGAGAGRASAGSAGLRASVRPILVDPGPPAGV